MDGIPHCTDCSRQGATNHLKITRTSEVARVCVVTNGETRGVIAVPREQELGFLAHPSSLISCGKGCLLTTVTSTVTRCSVSVSPYSRCKI